MEKNQNYHSHTGRIFMILVSIFIAIYCAYYSISMAQNKSVAFDEGYFASVAKNISNGNGYAISFEKLHPFHAEISTGPTIIFPAALAIKLFGQSIQVVRISRLLVCFVLIALMLFFIRKIYRLPIDIFSIILMLSIYLLSYETSGTIDIEQYRLTYEFLGDLPAALFFILAVIFCGKVERQKYKIIAGLLFGLAILTKVVLFIDLMGILFCIYLIEKNTFSYFFKKYISLIVLSLSLPFLWFIVVPFIYFAKQHKGLSSVFQYIRFFSGSGSGVREILIGNPVANLFNILESNFFKLNDYFGGFFFFLIFCILLIFILNEFKLIIEKYTSISPILKTGYLLLFAGFFHFMWWWVFSTRGWMRHLYPGMILLFVGLGIIIYVSQLSRHKKIVSFIFLGLLVASKLVVSESLFQPLNAHEERFIAQKKFAQHLEQEKNKNLNLIYVSCFPHILPDLEFLMSDSLNFRNCFDLREVDINNHDIHFVRTRYWNNEKAIFLLEAESLCKEVLYQDHDFIESRCEQPQKFQDIKAPETYRFVK